MRGLPRGRFALAGAAAATAFIGFLAVAIAPELLRAFGVVAFLVVPAFVAPFAAARMSAPRASRLTHSLYTAPITQSRWFAANILVTASVGVLYLVTTAPILAVIAWHLGAGGEIFQDFVPIAIGLILAYTAIGTFLGIVFTGRSLAAPVGLAVSIAVVSVMSGVFMAQVLQDPAPNRTLLAILHLFPHPNLLDAVSSEASGGLAPVDPAKAIVALAVTTLGFTLLSAWVYLRGQGPEDWEASPRHKGLTTLVVAAIVLAPAAAANDEYRIAEPSAPQVHIPGARPVNILASLGEPGASPLELDFLNPHLETADDPLAVNEDNERHLVLLLPVDPSIPVTNLTVEITIPAGRDNGTYLSRNFTFEQVARNETAPLPGAIVNGPIEGVVLRLPLTVNPGDPHGFSKNFYVAHIHAKYDVAGENKTRHAHAEIPIHAAVSDASEHLLIASLPAPLALAAFAFVRRLRIS